MSITREALEALRRAARSTGPSRVATLEETFVDRPLLQSRLLQILEEHEADGGLDESWLQTGGAWDRQLEERVAQAVRAEPLAVGDRVAHLRIVGHLGAGGMGAVYRGFDEKLERPVAVKTVHRRGVGGEDARRRFRQEARTLSKLNHPGICQVYDLVEADDSDLLVLELVDGVTLRQALAEEGEAQPEEEQVLRWAEDVARALAVAHEAGIVHRDLKPDNVMVTASGDVKILDFGIARLVSEPEVPGSEGAREAASSGGGSRGDVLATRAGSILGTVSYMSPEQARGEPVTPASDVFSLGLMLHEQVSEAPPHPPDASTAEILVRVSEARIDRPTGVSPELALLLTRMRALDPQARPTADAVADELERIRTAPARRRLRRLRRLTAAGVAASLLVAASIAGRARWKATQQAAAVEGFARESSEIVWRLRTVALSPAHDVRPAKNELRKRLLQLRTQLDSEEPVVAGRGHRALGRAWFALGEPGEALGHLESALDLLPDDAETNWWLGLVFGERYRRALADASMLRVESDRQAAVEEAQRAFRRPALRHLELSRGYPSADEQLVEALIASYEERFDEARDILSEYSPEPWSFEHWILLGDLARDRAGYRLSHETLNQEFVAALYQAVDFYRRATWIGRSSSRSHARICQTLAEAVYAIAIEELHVVSDDELAEMDEGCATARRVDSGSSEILYANGLMLVARALSLEQRGESAEDTYRRAIDLLSAEPSSDEDRGIHLFLRGQAHALLGWSAAFRGLDATESLEQAIEDLEQAVLLRPRDSAATNHLSNAYMVMAFQKLNEGSNPMPYVEAALKYVGDLLAADPENRRVQSSAASLQLMAGRYHLLHGGPAVEAFEQAAATYRLVARSKTPSDLGNLCLCLGDLGHALRRRGRDPSAVFEEAMDVCDQVVALRPDWSQSWAYRGLARSSYGEYLARSGSDPSPELEGALSDFDKALEISSDNTSSLYDAALAGIRWARWQLATGGNSEPVLTAAEARLKQWEVPSNGGWFHVRMADLNLLRGRHLMLQGADPRRSWQVVEASLEEARELLPGVARVGLLSAELSLDQAALAARSGSSDRSDELRRRALESLQHAQAADPLSADVLALRAVALSGLDGKTAAAREVLREAEAIDPTVRAYLQSVDPSFSQRLGDGPES